MAEYRIIFNTHGFVPQRHSWFGWDGITKTGKWYSEVWRCGSIEEARAAIDADIERRSRSTQWQQGAVVEIYSPLWPPNKVWLPDSVVMLAAVSEKELIDSETQGSYWQRVSQPVAELLREIRERQIREIRERQSDDYEQVSNGETHKAFLAALRDVRHLLSLIEPR